MPAKQVKNNSGESWADTLREAIKRDSRTAYAICQAAGIERSMLARFTAGKSINLTTAERLGRVLGIELHKTSKS